MKNQAEDKAVPDDLAARTELLETEVRSSDLRLEALTARLELKSAELKSQAEKLERRLEAAEASLVRARAVSEALWQSKPWTSYVRLGELRRRWAAGLRAVGALPAHWWRRARLQRTLTERLRAGGIFFAEITEPEVSVIIPVHDGIEVTVQCLESIHRSSNRTSAEVIVVDDASKDCSYAVLGSIRNLKVVRRRETSGFAKAAKAGADRARGRYLLFLRGNTVVRDGWLDELFRTFLESSQAGIVGSKLLSGEGRLLEAGGLVWQDGSASGFGRGDDPICPQYNYLREVDYCSAASLMVPRKLFQDLGGFDLGLTEAGYADADLAFRVKASGKKVLFQPLSEVVWLDSGSTDTDSGRIQEEFRKRWSEVLGTHRPQGESALLEKERSVRRRVLIIDHHLPTPDQDSGSLRMVNLFKVFQGLGVKVSFIPHDLIPMQPYTDNLRRSGIEIHCWPPTVSIEQHLKAFGSHYDAVLLSRLHVAWPCIDLVKRYCPRAMLVFDTVDLQFLRRRRFGELRGDEGALREARLAEARELDLVRRADLTLVVSPVEKDVLAGLAPEARVEIVSNVHEVHGCKKAFEERKDIFFIGGFEHRPNVDSVKWLVEEIFPHIRELLPGVRLYLIGSKPPDEVLALAADDIEVLGYVADVEPYFVDCKLSIAPLRYGAGVKGKVNHSMAYGLPCVATSVAVEGMGLRDGEDVLVADDPQQFAECVQRAYTDQELWTRLSNGGLENIRKHFSFDAAQAALCTALPFLSTESEPVVSRPESLEFVECRSQEELLGFDALPIFRRARALETALALAHQESDHFELPGYCLIDGAEVQFSADFAHGAVNEEGMRIPNWRGRLVCPLCGLGNRQRAIAWASREAIRRRAALTGRRQNLYMMEQVTPLYKLFNDRVPEAECDGSEYLGPGIEGGTIVDGIRHEDAENLSFPSESMDFVLSSDVLEHVSNPAAAVHEISRVLRPGGELFLSVPFFRLNARNHQRARLEHDEIIHIDEPQYHGNPLSPEGSLVFTDFGWELVEQIRSAGLSCSAFAYWSRELGHLGASGQFFFRAVKG
ncbi:MAG: glycosyltransferase [Acidobacteria bacterium]|nr:glycosyltransferase [Acidobacteriota bacterium]